MILTPTDTDWFDQLVADVKSLRGTNNFVPIFNGRKKTACKRRAMVLFSDFDAVARYPGTEALPASDPATLKRIKDYLMPWFDAMKRKLKALQLLAAPRHTREEVVLVSLAGCQKQALHWDYDPVLVQPLIEDKKYIGVPLSVLVSFTPRGSRLDVEDADSGVVESVVVPFGSMLIWTGDVVHAGDKYSEINLRGFLHCEHPSLTFKDDEVHLSLSKKASVDDDLQTATPIPEATAIETGTTPPIQIATAIPPGTTPPIQIATAIPTGTAPPIQIATPPIPGASKSTSHTKKSTRHKSPHTPKSSPRTPRTPKSNRPKHKAKKTLGVTRRSRRLNNR